MERKFRFGIIGCGVIAKVHQQEIAKIDNAELVAVADVLSQRAKQLGELAHADWYTDYKEMLERDDIDIINIATPSGMHADMTIAAAERGKHVIVEKPMDISYDKALSMIEACRKNRVKLAVISQHRFDESTVRVKDEIRRQSLGRMVLGQAAVNWYRSQGYYDSGAWRGTWELDGGGALMNQSIHTIDLLQYFMGDVDSIFAHTATLSHERIEVEDVAVATVKFRSGAQGTIVGTTSAYPGYSARVEVFGTHGSAVIDSDILTHLYIRADGEEGNAYGGGAALNLAGTGREHSTTAAADAAAISTSSHQLQFVDMMNAIEEDREPMVNGEEGLKPLQIILAIYESARTGQVIKL